jgi:transposase InsO family protein
MARTSLQERAAIRALANAGKRDPEIAQELHLSRYTVRKWRRRAKEGKGLGSKMGRPNPGALGSFPVGMKNQLQEWRRANPGWGAKTLLAELKRCQAMAGQAMPSRATIGRWLQEARLTRSYAKHSQLPAVPRSAEACHEEWEMDGRGGERVKELGWVSLVQVNDVYSRAKILSYPCVLGPTCRSHRPTTEDYQLLLRLAFTEWGLPDRLAVDHDSVFFDNRNASPFPTRFHLWLVALGIQLTFGRVGRPTDQGMTERSHQLWYHQVLQGQSFASQADLFQALQERRTFLNQYLPCATLGEVPPLVAYPEARFPRRLYRPDLEPSLLCLDRVFAYLSHQTWFRLASEVGSIKLGQMLFFLGSQWKRKQIEISFDPDTRLMICHTEDLEKRLPFSRLSIPFLMGELDPLFHQANLQLALPFSTPDLRTLQLCQLLTGTTL